MTIVEFLQARLTDDVFWAEHHACRECEGDSILPNPGCRVRVLREVEAKRAIVALYESSVRRVSAGLSVPQRRAAEALAAVYADHPDFDTSWAVTT